MGLKVLNVHFDDAADEALVFNYQLGMQDDGDDSLLSHTFVSGSSAYSTQIMSGSGDQDPTDNSVIDIDTQILADDLWVGDGWSGMFYFAVSDFNYVSIPDTYASNPRPDDDWGYNPAYYFNVTLVYHPGLSRPE
jgi:hypothetical protein